MTDILIFQSFLKKEYYIIVQLYRRKFYDGLIILVYFHMGLLPAYCWNPYAKLDVIVNQNFMLLSQFPLLKELLLNIYSTRILKYWVQSIVVKLSVNLLFHSICYFFCKMHCSVLKNNLDAWLKLCLQIHSWKITS